MKIVLVEDEAAARNGIGNMLRQHTQHELCAVAANGVHSENATGVSNHRYPDAEDERAADDAFPKSGRVQGRIHHFEWLFGFSVCAGSTAAGGM